MIIEYFYLLLVYAINFRANVNHKRILRKCRSKNISVFLYYLDFGYLSNWVLK